MQHRLSRKRIKGVAFKKAGVWNPRASLTGHAELNGAVAWNLADTMEEIPDHNHQPPSMGDTLGRRNASQSLAQAMKKLLTQMQTLKPKVLSADRLHKLFLQMGRHELHTLVSDSVDALLTWRNVLGSLERELAKPVTGRPLTADEIEIVVEARWILLRLKQQIQILEMISQAQKSLQNFGVLK